MSTATQNGTTPKKEVAGLQTVKPADKVTEAPKVTPTEPAITLTSQRDKAERLNLLFEREEKLSSTKKALDRFKLATDESTNELELRDGKGATFRTSNPTLIKVVLKDIQDELIIKQKQIADDIIAIG